MSSLTIVQRNKFLKTWLLLTFVRIFWEMCIKLIWKWKKWFFDYKEVENYMLSRTVSSFNTQYQLNWINVLIKIINFLISRKVEKLFHISVRIFTSVELIILLSLLDLSYLFVSISSSFTKMKHTRKSLQRSKFTIKNLAEKAHSKTLNFNYEKFFNDFPFYIFYLKIF